MYCSKRHKTGEEHCDYKSFANERTQSLNNDLEGSLSTTRTLEVLKLCKIKIIGPFNIMLTMVGWRSLTTQFYCPEKYLTLVKIADKTILLLFISLLIFSYVYQVLACRFKMNINDEIMTIGPRLTTTASFKNITGYSIIDLLRTTAIETEKNGIYMSCYHLSTTYVIPNFIHFIAYIVGMIHYRYRENEDIYGLMEKTVQYSAIIGSRRNNYFSVSKMLTFWMVMSAIWLLLSIINHVLYDVTYNTFMSPFYIFKINDYDDIITSNIKHLMFILDFLGYIIMSMVSVTIVLNYTIYCELVKFYVDAISKKIEMRSIKLNVIKNDMENVSGCIDLINGVIGGMTTLILILLFNLLIVGINNLMSFKDPKTLEIAFRFYFVIHLIPPMLTASIQCVRVNLAMETFKRWGRHMSVFGYRKETKKDLDSFFLFTMGFNSKARLMALPLEWWHLLTIFILIGFILITLIQTCVMDRTFIFKNL